MLPPDIVALLFTKILFSTLNGAPAIITMTPPRAALLFLKVHFFIFSEGPRPL